MSGVFLKWFLCQKYEEILLQYLPCEPDWAPGVKLTELWETPVTGLVTLRLVHTQPPGLCELQSRGSALSTGSQGRCHLWVSAPRNCCSNLGGSSLSYDLISLIRGVVAFQFVQLFLVKTGVMIFKLRAHWTANWKFFVFLFLCVFWFFSVPYSYFKEFGMTYKTDCVHVI